AITFSDHGVDGAEPDKSRRKAEMQRQTIEAEPDEREQEAADPSSRHGQQKKAYADRRMNAPLRAPPNGRSSGLTPTLGHQKSSRSASPFRSSPGSRQGS